MAKVQVSTSTLRAAVAAGAGLASDEAVEAYLASARSRGLAEATLDLYRMVLSRFAAHEPALPCPVEAVESFLGRVHGAAPTRHVYYRSLRTFFHWCADRYGLANPMAGLRAPVVRTKPMRTLVLSQLVDLLRGCEPGGRDEALLLLLLDTGIRIGEAATLEPEDVTGDAITVSGKTGTRTVPVTSSVATALRRHLPWRGQRGRLTRSGLQQAVKRAMARAGIAGRRASPHTLRHSFAKQYLMAGGDVFSLQRIMGHRELRTTQGYLALVDQDVRYQHARFSPLVALARAASGENYEEIARGGRSGRVETCLWAASKCRLPADERCPVMGAVVWTDESKIRKARECPWGVAQKGTAPAAVGAANQRRRQSGEGQHRF